jgi:hypothetical protein
MDILQNKKGCLRKRDSLDESKVRGLLSKSRKKHGTLWGANAFPLSPGSAKLISHYCPAAMRFV